MFHTFALLLLLAVVHYWYVRRVFCFNSYSTCLKIGGAAGRRTRGHSGSLILVEVNAARKPYATTSGREKGLKAAKHPKTKPAGALSGWSELQTRPHVECGRVVRNHQANARLGRGEPRTAKREGPQALNSLADFHGHRHSLEGGHRTIH